MEVQCSTRPLPGVILLSSACMPRVSLGFTTDHEAWSVSNPLSSLAVRLVSVPLAVRIRLRCLQERSGFTLFNTR